MGLRSISEAVVFDAGHQKPIRKLVSRGIDGPVYEKIPNIRHEKWVNRKGHVVRLALATGSALDERTCHRESRDRREIMAASGGIPYAKCCLAMGLVPYEDFPEDMRTPCRPSECGENKACDHVEFVIAHRQGREKQFHEAQKKRMRKRVEAEKDRHEETTQAIAEGFKAIKQVIGDRVSDDAEEPAKPKARKKGRFQKAPEDDGNTEG